MDMNKFYECLVNDDFVKDIPLSIVLRVAVVVFEIINSGKCFYELEEVADV